MEGSIAGRGRRADMKFQFDIGERARTVEIRRQPDAYRITVDGRACVVDAVRIAGDTWSLIVRDVETQRVTSVDAVVGPQNGHGSVCVYIGGQPIEVSLREGVGRRSRADAAGQGSGLQRISAPMPGKIVRVLVGCGDEVEPRQGLVIVEAMKMENELRASRGGRVREVFVSEGQSVEAGTVLIEVE